MKWSAVEMGRLKVVRVIDKVVNQLLAKSHAETASFPLSINIHTLWCGNVLSYTIMTEGRRLEMEHFPVIITCIIKTI